MAQAKTHVLIGNSLKIITQIFMPIQLFLFGSFSSSIFNTSSYMSSVLIDCLSMFLPEHSSVSVFPVRPTFR